MTKSQVYQKEVVLTHEMHDVDIEQGANQALQTIPFQEQFADIAEIDYSLVQPPTFGSSYLTLNAKGEFYYVPDKTVSSPALSQRKLRYADPTT